MHFKSFLCCVCWVAVAQPGLAQTITPDATMGPEASQVVPVDAVTDRIEAGAIRGPNLFHSFETFKIDAGRVVYFANPIGITDIFSRVTGTEGSEILGTLGVDGDASLYLLNPNGILFGPDAQLDINGSFIGSTAGQFRFGSGLEFSAAIPQAAPLLNMAVEPGLQLGNATTGTIAVDGDLRIGQELKFEANRVEVGGTLETPANISIIATEAIDINQGKVTTRLGAGAIGTAGDVLLQSPEIGIQGDGDGAPDAPNVFSISNGDGNAGNIVLDAGDGTIRLTGAAIKSTLGREGNGSSGDIILNAGAVEAAGAPGFTLIVSDAKPEVGDRGIGNVGSVTINASERVHLTDKTVVGTYADGQSISVGDVSIQTGELKILGPSFVQSFTSSKLPDSQGTGNIRLSATDSFEIDGGSQVRTHIVRDSFGNSGDISIQSSDIEIDNGALVWSSAEGVGNTGDITLVATDSFEIDDDSRVHTEIIGMGMGDAGDILIQSPEMEIKDDSLVWSSVEGVGDSGKVTLQADGGDILIRTRGTVKSSIERQGSGQGGDVEINTARLKLEGGIVYAESLSTENPTGIGNGGNIDIYASESVVIERGNSRNNPIGFIGTRVNENGSSAGDISIRTRVFKGLEGSFVESFSESDLPDEAGTGEIRIIATDSFLLDDKSKVSTNIREDHFGTAGDIYIESADIKVTDRAQILSQLEGTGSAGSITLEAGDGNILISDRGKVKSSTLETGRGDSGDAVLNAARLDVVDRGEIYVESRPDNGDSGRGNAGKISITVSEEVNFTDSALIGSQMRGKGSFTEGILINTQYFNMSQDSALLSLADGASEDAIGTGDIEINATRSFIIDNSRILANQGDNSFGNAGEMRITSPLIRVTNDSGITSLSQGFGDGGDMTLRTNGGTIELINDVALSSNIGEEGIGKAGDILLEAREILMVGPETRIEALNRSKDARSQGGNIRIEAEDTLDMQGGVRVVSSLGQPAFRRTRTLDPNSPWIQNEDGEPRDLGLGSRGSAGNISVEVGRLSMDEASFQANTLGEGNAGSINITASGAIVVNNSLDAVSTKVGIDSAGQVASGEAGDITITTPSLELLQGSRIISSTQGTGPAGNITISVNGDVTLSGEINTEELERRRAEIVNGLDGLSPEELEQIQRGELSNELLAPLTPGEIDTIRNAAACAAETCSSGLYSTAEQTAQQTPMGDQLGGSINVTADGLAIADQARIDVSTSSDRPAGSIGLTVNNLEINNGQVSSSTSSAGTGGDINVVASDRISLSNAGSIDAGTDGLGTAGSVTLDSNQLTIGTESQVSSTTRGASDGGPIEITARDGITLADDGKINASTTGGGRAGDITLRTNGLELDNAEVSSSTSSTGSGGDIQILPSSSGTEVDSITLSNGGQINAESREGLGEAGEISLEARTVEITGSAPSNADQVSQISSSTVGDEDGADVTVTATERLRIAEGGQINASTAGQGDAGDIALRTDILEVDGGIVNSSTTGGGTGGNITVGSAEDNAVATSIALTNGGQINAESVTEQGQAGSVTLAARTVTIANDGSQIRSSTQGTQAGGDVTVTAVDQLRISDDGEINASTTGAGSAGNIALNTDRLEIDGGEVNSSTEGAGIGGNIRVGSADPGAVSTSIALSNGGRINAESIANAGKAGSVDLDARTVTVTGDGSQIRSSSQGSQGGGEVAVTAIDQLRVAEGGAINASTTGIGNAGNVTLQTNQLAVDGGEVVSSTSGQGRGGDIIVTNVDAPTAERIDITNGGQINAESTNGLGQAGSVTLNGQTVTVVNPGSQVSSSTTGAAQRGGNVTINAPERLRIADQGQVDASSRGAGQSGRIRVETNQLQIETSGQLSTLASGQGNRTTQGDEGEVTAIDVTVGDRIQISSGGRIDASTTGTDQAGGIKLRANTIDLDDGRVSSSTSAAGDGGSLDVEANERISISNEGGFEAIAQAGSSGDAGRIRLRANNIELQDGGRVSSSTFSAGDGGSLDVEASERISIRNGSGLEAIAQAGSTGNSGNITLKAPEIDIRDRSRVAISVEDPETPGTGGNVTIDAARALTMEQDSLIQTDSKGRGDGGNITITAPFIFGFLGGNSDIIANAKEGSGGNITIESNALLNFIQQNQPNTESLRQNTTNDISASSEFGVSGNLSLGGLNVDPSQGSGQLPSSPAADSQVDASCSAQTANRNSFVVTGRSGIPLSPTEPQSTALPLAHWVSLPSELSEPAMAATNASYVAAETLASHLAEASGWQQQAGNPVTLTGGEQQNVPRFAAQRCAVGRS